MAFPGDELRAKREERGLSVDDVYRKLRIPADCVAALESGAAERLPAMCYTTGFLKTYCDYLELDPEPFLEALKESTSPPTGFLGRPKNVPVRESLPWLNDLATWAAITAIFALGWLTYAVVFQPKAEPGDGKVQAGAIEGPVTRPADGTRP